MKKMFCYILVLFFIVVKLFGHNFSLDAVYPFQEDSNLDGMIVDGNNLILEYKDVFFTKPNKTIKFQIKHIYGMPFMELSENMPKEIAEWDIYEKNKETIQTNNRILFLACKRNSYVTMFAFTKGYSMQFRPVTSTRYDEFGSLYKDCSSFLIEKSKSYPVENLRKLTVDTPWIENAKGDGIGEGFTIISNSSQPLGSYLLIINGYISYEKPYLYEQNGRIKKIKVTGLNSGKSKILNILDTPHPQTVDISFITESEDIRVEIVDIYKGSKYDDTCIHYCITFNEEVVPYEDSIYEFFLSDDFDK